MAPWLTRWVVYSAVLFAGFSTNLYCIPESCYWSHDAWRGGYIGYDSALVMNRLAAESGPLAPLIFWNPQSQAAEPYRSQLGLQGVILGGIARMTHANPDRFGTAMAAVFALLTAMTLAGFATDVARRIGAVVGNTVVMLLAATIALMPFAASLYWATFTLFAPFVLVWMTYPWAVESPRRMILLCAGVFILTVVKCLCGYEYVTTVVLAPTAAITFHVVRMCAGVRAWRLHSLLLTFAGGLGFGGALGLHIAQLTCVQGEDGLRIIQTRAAHRTGFADPTHERQYAFLAPDPVFIPEPYRTPARCFLNYFWQPALSTPATWGKAARSVSLGSVCCVLGVLVLVVGCRRHRWPPEIRGLAAAVGVGFVASVSWQMLAVNHMCIHSHLNQIVFVVPFLLPGYALLGAGIQYGLERLGWVPVADTLSIVTGLTLVGINFLVMTDRARQSELADRQATLAVQKALDSGEPIPATTLPASIDSLVVSQHPPHPSLGVFMSRGLTPAAAGQPDPCIIIQGWAFDPPRHKYQTSVRIVIACGQRIIPATVEYYRRPDIDQLAARRLPGAAFFITIRQSEVSEPLRVLAVSGRNGDTTSELPLPKQNHTGTPSGS